MSKQQATIERFRESMVQLNMGFDEVAEARKYRDGYEWQDLDEAERDVKMLEDKNKEWVDKAKNILSGLSTEDLKIAQEELREHALATFSKLGEADIEHHDALIVRKDEEALWKGQILGIGNDCGMMDKLMEHANAELAARSGHEKSYVNLLEAAYNQDYAQDKLSVRLEMADKLIKKGRNKERAELLCFHGSKDMSVKNKQTYYKNNVDYAKEYKDKSEEFNKLIDKHTNKKDPYVAAFLGKSQSSEEVARIKSEFDIKQACLEYKKAAIFGSEDEKHEARQAAGASIAIALMLHPDCKDYKGHHPESVQVRERVAQILLDKSVNDAGSIFGRLSSRIKDVITGVKDALHLGSQGNRKAALVAKDIVTSLKEHSRVSSPAIAPAASDKATTAKQIKSHER